MAPPPKSTVERILLASGGTNAANVSGFFSSLLLKKDAKVGKYTLIEKLGSGGFGEVWKVEKRTKLSISTFAIKFFRAKDDDEIDLSSVIKEVEVWQKLSGLPHIISVIEGNQFEDYVYIVSEFADGGSLDKWLRSNGDKANSYQEAVSIISQILQGLEGMHSEGFVHSDLKPANILLKRNILYLADFGTSRQIICFLVKIIAVIHKHKRILFRSSLFAKRRFAVQDFGRQSKPAHIRFSCSRH